MRDLRHTWGNPHIAHVINSSEALDYLFGTGSYRGRDVTHHPACILLSLPLPDRQGLALLGTLKSYASTRTIPVITLAQNCNDTLVEQAIRLGANDHFVKGPDPQLLIDCVQHYGEAITRQPDPLINTDLTIVSTRIHSR